MSGDLIRYEKTDARVSPIVKYAVGLLIFTAVSAGAAFAVMYGFREAEKKHDVAPAPMAVRDPSRLPPQPRLQVHPTFDAVELHKQEHEQLTSYGWVDQQKGTVRIPVAAAIDLLVARGLPTRAEAPAASPAPASPVPGSPAAPAAPAATPAAPQPEAHR